MSRVETANRTTAGTTTADPTATRAATAAQTLQTRPVSTSAAAPARPLSRETTHTLQSAAAVLNPLDPLQNAEEVRAHKYGACALWALRASSGPSFRRS